MGLDMYLMGRRVLYPTTSNDDRSIADNIQRLFPELDNITLRGLDQSPVTKINVEVAYWRKANAVHKWFVDNCQNGIDDCGTYYVSREKLGELRGLCAAILADPDRATELLPTQSGFFFGGTAYDQWYFRDLEYTVEAFDAALLLPIDWVFEYHSSW